VLRIWKQQEVISKLIASTLVASTLVASTLVAAQLRLVTSIGKLARRQQIIKQLMVRQPIKS
jgi:hypothetical protein